MRKPHYRSDSVLGRAIALVFSGRSGNLFQVINVHGDFGCSESRLEFPQMVSLGEPEIVALLSASACGLDRVTMKKLICASPAGAFFVHCAAPVGGSRALR